MGLMVLVKKMSVPNNFHCKIPILCLPKFCCSCLTGLTNFGNLLVFNYNILLYIACTCIYICLFPKSERINMIFIFTGLRLLLSWDRRASSTWNYSWICIKNSFSDCCVAPIQDIKSSSQWKGGCFVRKKS